MVLRWFLVTGILVTLSAHGQVWNEVGDAKSFPDKNAQVTVGSGSLTTITGATDFVEQRDAYCIKVTNPAAFRATTDPNTDPGATASFDTRLFLFNQYGAPVLANDDTPPSADPFLSTLTGTATDGSGFVLDRGGEYILLITGFSEDPQDTAALELFNIDAGFSLVHAPNPAAGRFEAWQAPGATNGTYTIKLEGTAYCQTALDVVAVNDDSTSNAVCLNDGTGQYPSCADMGAGELNSGAVALGFVDGDGHLDAVVTNLDSRAQICLGNGTGGFQSCTEISASPVGSRDVALGFVNGDGYLDVVLARGLNQRDQVCPGDGSGGFSSCVDVSTDESESNGVALGYFDGDAWLDALFAKSDVLNQICLGNGSGGFSCAELDHLIHDTQAVMPGFLDGDTSLDALFINMDQKIRACLGNGAGGFLQCYYVIEDEYASRDGALGFLNGDEYPDAVIPLEGPDLVCLGDGAGGFASCSLIDTGPWRSYTVDLGLVNDDLFLDAVFGTNYHPNYVCYGDGAGSFSSCSELGVDIDRTLGIALGELGAPGPAVIFKDGFESPQ